MPPFFICQRCEYKECISLSSGMLLNTVRSTTT